MFCKEMLLAFGAAFLSVNFSKVDVTFAFARSWNVGVLLEISIRFILECWPRHLGIEVPYKPLSSDAKYLQKNVIGVWGCGFSRLILV